MGYRIFFSNRNAIKPNTNTYLAPSGMFDTGPLAFGDVEGVRKLFDRARFYVGEHVRLSNLYAERRSGGGDHLAFLDVGIWLHSEPTIVQCRLNQANNWFAITPQNLTVDTGVRLPVALLVTLNLTALELPPNELTASFEVTSL
jgi:hypothetical protein